MGAGYGLSCLTTLYDVPPEAPSTPRDLADSPVIPTREQFRSIQVRPAEPPGRALDFLCQELFREFNTIGSKANDASIAQIVVEAKTELEKIREQVQNVE